jgi:hypothetical protein
MINLTKTCPVIENVYYCIRERALRREASPLASGKVYASGNDVIRKDRTRPPAPFSETCSAHR